MSLHIYSTGTLIVKSTQDCCKPFKIAWDYEVRYGGSHRLPPDIDNNYYWRRYITSYREDILPQWIYVCAKESMRYL